MDQADWNFYEIARVAYEAYCNSTGWKSAITGASLPSFENCPEAVKRGWMAVAREMVSVIRNPKSNQCKLCGRDQCTTTISDIPCPECGIGEA